jgi:putative spermidine/putrescine transport system permease protein
MAVRTGDHVDERSSLDEPEASEGESRSWLARWGWVVLALPPLVYIAAVFFYGFVRLFLDSLGMPAADPSFDTYRGLLDSAAFRRAFVRTTRLAVVVTVVCALISYPVAYYVARVEPHRRNRFLLLILLPWLTSIVVRSFGWRILLGPRGLVNGTLMSLGVIDQPIQLINNEFGVAIGLVHVLAPFMMLSLLSVFMAVDPRLEEGAAMLGAGPVRTFFRVLVPLTRTGLVTGSLLVFLLTVAAVVTPQILGGVRDRTIAVLMYSQLLELYNFQRGAAMAFVLVLLVVPVAITLQLFERRWNR